jgi:fluoride exporter
MIEELAGVWALLAVALGSALGGMARYWLGTLIDRRSDGSWPTGTLVVNFSGAFCIGLASAILGTDELTSLPWALLVTGFLGSYTTVSSFSLQTLLIARQGRVFRAVMHVGLSVTGCLLAAVVGMVAGQWIMGAGA